jgi:hypothetical protein
VKRKALPPCAPWFRSVHDRGRRPQPANGMTSPPQAVPPTVEATTTR